MLPREFPTNSVKTMDQSLGGTPGEVFEIVIRYCFRDRTLLDEHGVTQILQVSRQWSAVCLKLIYTNITLRNPTLISFTRVHGNSNLGLVRSLTIIIAPIEPPELAKNPDGTRKSRDEVRRVVDHGSEATKQLLRALRAMPKVLEQMAEVTCFSLSVQEYHKTHGPNGFWLSADDIYDIVAKLPPSITSLELDTKCSDKHAQDPGDKHICSLIATRLP